MKLNDKTVLVNQRMSFEETRTHYWRKLEYHITPFLLSMKNRFEILLDYVSK